jgi:hypothetical protein
MRTTPRRAALGPPPANRAKRRDEPPEAGRKRRQRRPAPVLPAPCATPGYLADWAKRAVEFPMPLHLGIVYTVLSRAGDAAACWTRPRRVRAESVPKIPQCATGLPSLVSGALTTLTGLRSPTRTHEGPSYVTSRVDHSKPLRKMFC